MNADPAVLAAVLAGMAEGVSVKALATIDVPVLVINGRGDVANQRTERVLAALPRARALACEGDHVTTPFQPSCHRAVIEFLRSNGDREGAIARRRYRAAAYTVRMAMRPAALLVAGSIVLVAGTGGAVSLYLATMPRRMAHTRDEVARWRPMTPGAPVTVTAGSSATRSRSTAILSPSTLPLPIVAFKPFRAGIRPGLCKMIRVPNGTGTTTRRADGGYCSGFDSRRGLGQATSNRVPHLDPADQAFIVPFHPSAP